jgi:hypothetical protein
MCRMDRGIIKYVGIGYVLLIDTLMVVGYIGRVSLRDMCARLEGFGKIMKL